jgi:CheY-like chemotaxis protein
MTRLLLVDDDTALRGIIAALLRNTGHTVVEVSSGTEALKRAEAEHFDLFLLDVMMPDMDGYALARRLREQPATHEAPILMLTANVQGPDPELARLSGADGYDVKTVNAGRLNRKIAEVLAKRRAPQAPSESAQ